MKTKKVAPSKNDSICPGFSGVSGHHSASAKRSFFYKTKFESPIHQPSFQNCLVKDEGMRNNFPILMSILKPKIKRSLNGRILNLAILEYLGDTTSPRNNPSNAVQLEDMMQSCSLDESSFSGVLNPSLSSLDDFSFESSDATNANNNTSNAVKLEGMIQSCSLAEASSGKVNDKIRMQKVRREMPLQVNSPPVSLDTFFESISISEVFDSEPEHNNNIMC